MSRSIPSALFSLLLIFAGWSAKSPGAHAEDAVDRSTDQADPSAMPDEATEAELRDGGEDLMPGQALAPIAAPAPAPTRIPVNVVCQSDSLQYKTCPVARPPHAKFQSIVIRGMSKPPLCKLGHSYGYDPGAVWVDFGCRSGFTVWFAR